MDAFSCQGMGTEEFRALEGEEEIEGREEIEGEGVERLYSHRLIGLGI